jgi:phage-related protein
MSSIIKAVSDLVSSLVELVWSFFTTAGALVQNTASFAAKFANEIIQLVISFFQGLVDLAGGIVSFALGKSSHTRNAVGTEVNANVCVVGNVLMLAVLAAAVFGFLQYQRSQGRSVQVGNKKLN